MKPNELMDYNGWANRLVLDTLKEISDPTDRRLKLMGHILGAEHFWLDRMEKLDLEKKVETPVNSFPEMTWAICDRLLKRNIARMDKFLAEMIGDNDGQLIVFHDRLGNLNQIPLPLIFFSINNHGAYHRGQIAQLHRAAGGKPADSGFVRYFRERYAK